MPRELLSRPLFLPSCSTQPITDFAHLIAKQLFFTHLSFTHDRVSCATPPREPSRHCTHSSGIWPFH